MKTADGLIDEGEIVDIEGVSKALAAFWREYKIPEKRVVIGVANQKVVVRVIEMPYMSESELRSALQYQISDYIPIPVEEAIIDFQILTDNEANKQSGKMDVLVAAARKDMIENAIAAVKGAGLKPVIVDISSLAFARAVLEAEPERVLREPDEDKGATALVNISSTLTDIIIVEDGVPRFTRISGTGGRVFTDAIVEQLGVSVDEAEELKMAVGLPQVGDKMLQPVSDDPKIRQYYSKVQGILELEMERFVAEIRRSLDYYIAQSTNVRRIEKVIVSGGGVRLNNFIEQLKASLMMEVELAQPLKSVQIKRRTRIANVKEDELSMAICIGLGMRGMQ
jgi:type IV pilus assembly protein PilM